MQKIAIPPRCDAVLDVKHHQKRNDNLSEIKESGRMAWQKINRIWEAQSF